MCLNSYWLQMSIRSLGLLFVRSLVLRILLCIPRCFHLVHDGAMNFPLGLNTAPRHHASMMSLHSSYYSLSLNYRRLFFRTSIHSSLLVGNYVCDISYKSNAFLWLETFHKEYSQWQILMHKYVIMQLFQPIKHSSISHRNFLDAFHLYQDNIEILH